MPRYALTLEYDGAAFVGWQRQAGRLSVQAAVEAAAGVLDGVRDAAAQPAAVAAGRTDAGVHAEGQVVQLELARALAPERLREALNFHLRPHPVAVVRAAPAPAGWHARFSAIERRYRYIILNRRAPPVLAAGRVWHVPQPLDAAAMARAAASLLGRHDFSAYRAAACQARSALRTLESLTVTRDGEAVVVRAGARSFLHHQVRNLVGTLLRVGEGKQPETWPRDVLDGRDRARAGQTAPAAGLCLLAVAYPTEPDWV